MHEVILMLQSELSLLFSIIVCYVMKAVMSFVIAYKVVFV